MKKFWVGIILFCCCLLGGFIYAKNIPKYDSESKRILPKLEGIWLMNKYITTLKETKSPFQAVHELYEVQITFYKNKDISYSISIIYNFHEGLGPDIEQMVYKGNNEFEVICRDPYYKKNVSYSIKVNSLEKPSKMEFTYPYEKQIHKLEVTKIREKDPQDFINKQILRGNYKDSLGNTYIFQDNRTAIWPDTTFRYRVGLDYVFDKHNYILVVDQNDKCIGDKGYTFEWKNRKLYFYKAKFQMDWLVPEKEPFLILER